MECCGHGGSNCIQTLTFLRELAQHRGNIGRMNEERRSLLDLSVALSGHLQTLQLNLTAYGQLLVETYSDMCEVVLPKCYSGFEGTGLYVESKLSPPSS